MNQQTRNLDFKDILEPNEEV